MGCWSHVQHPPSIYTVAPTQVLRPQTEFILQPHPVWQLSLWLHPPPNNPQITPGPQAGPGIHHLLPGAESSFLVSVHSCPLHSPLHSSWKDLFEPKSDHATPCPPTHTPGWNPPPHCHPLRPLPATLLSLTPSSFLPKGLCTWLFPLPWKT